MNCPRACARLLLSLSLLLLALAPCQAKPRPSATAPASLNEADAFHFAFQYDPPRIPYIIIQVSINGKPPLPFMLDTGTNTPIIVDMEAAKSLGLKMSGIRGTANNGRVSFGDTSAVKSVLLRGLTAGRDIDFKGDGAVVADLALVKERFPWIKLAGVFGVNLLEQFTIRLDFSHKVLTFYVKPHPPVLIPGIMAVPLVDREDEHRYLVRISPIEGLTADLLLDTGSVGTSLPLAVANQVYSTPRYGNSVGRLGTYYILQTLLLPKIKVGNAIVYNFEASSLPAHTLCTLGNDFLSCFRVTVDFPHRQMFLEREVDRPYRLQGWVGVGLKPDGNDFRVRALEPGSPAAAAGLQTGDKILSVDGHPLQGLSVEAAKTLRDDPAGTRTTFLLQRGTSEPFSLPFITGSLFDAPPDIESGLVVEKPDGQPITIMQVDAGFAAQRAGLVAGDTIIAVDGVPSKSLSFDQTNDAFNKDSLTLTVRRAGESKPRVIVLAK